MRTLVRELGHPERAFKSVLIAGTNGKGSVSAYLDQALRAASLRVGRYTSPHLIDVRERITIDGEFIGPADFERRVLEIRDLSENLIRKRVLAQHPNHFEILTLAAFLHFKHAEVDLAILEVGLGGRLDATNVVSPLVSAIVSIDFDHEEYLGDTLSKIAAEKAGVARKGRPLVLGPLPHEAERTIRGIARKAGASVIPAFRGVALRESPAGLALTTPVSRYRGLRPLEGAHQRANLVVAIRLFEVLIETAGFDVEPQVAIAAMSRAVWPGRLERIWGRPAFLLDGAHNPAGARALGAYLDRLPTSHLLVFGAMKDKRVKEMAAELFPRARLVIGTRVRMARAAATEQLASIGRELGVPVLEEKTVPLALKRARRAARAGETVVVAGSLYLVGAVRKALLG